MSAAAAAWDLNAAPVRVPRSVPGRAARSDRPAVLRPRLVLVPTGDAVPSAAPGRLRLTRAGRLAITVTVAALLLAVVTVSLLSRAGAAPATVADHAVTVAQGQTLSEIAARELPNLSVADAVAELQLANNLASAHVHAGQVLVVPARG